jgi:diguanylate cyclase (GGDEF)-like protein
VLYLENNAADAVFTDDRVFLLRHLSGQIAISIDNAQGYQLLEDKVAERTAHIETQKAALEEKNRELQARNATISALNQCLRNENKERRSAERELQKANEELQRLATVDGLTQIANRRRFDACLESECQRLLRDKTPLALILCDIDYFKVFNDRYGHQAGDVCLQRVAQAIAGALRRPTDLAARYGGEEFAVVMPHTDAQGAIKVADSIRQAVADLQIPHQGSQVAEFVTVSIGIATAMPFHKISPSSLIKIADGALYQVKNNGRNGIVQIEFA